MVNGTEIQAIRERHRRLMDDVVVVVFVGPDNDSGKTTALQALSLWELGLRRWHERWGMVPTSDMQRPRSIHQPTKDLFSVPVNHAFEPALDGVYEQFVKLKARNPELSNVRIEIEVQGRTTSGKAWSCGFERFDTTPTQSLFYCRPLRTNLDGQSRMPVPVEALEEKVAFLAPNVRFVIIGGDASARNRERSPIGTGKNR